MPESAQKRRLVSKLNEANGKGTPDVSMSGSVRTMGRRQRRRSGDASGLINLLTPRRKRTVAHGSYTFRQPPEVRQVELGHSFRRQNSLHPEPLGQQGMCSSVSKKIFYFSFDFIKAVKVQ